jgi:WS/DGAT/MGAT family acyltransferase
MRRLKGQDAAFWYGETASWHMHVGVVCTVDTSDAPDFSFDRVRDLLVERIHLLPQFRWRAVETPLHIDRPVWVEDDDFDVDFHIRRVSVPAPGLDAELRALTGRLMSYQLNRRRPLWEIWFIDGLRGDRVAMLIKTHHAIIDGVSGAGLAEILFDITPEPRHVEPGPAPETAGPAASGWEMFVRGLYHSLVGGPVRTAKLAITAARQGAAIPSQLRAPDRPPMPIVDSPRVLWSGDVTPHRAWGAARIEIERVKAVKNAAGVKINDVVLALCAGAMRRYLVDRDALPDRPLVVSVPVSLRTESDASHVGSKVGNMFVSLATNVEDPLARLNTIFVNTKNAKEIKQASSARSLIGITEAMPPAFIGLAARAASSWGLGLGIGATPINAVVSNVPGPTIPLYVAGGLMESMIPLGPLLLGVGLNITAFSYLGWMDFGLQTCPELIAEIDDLAAGIPAELTALEQALGVRARRRTSSRRKKSATTA